jgi:arylsulfatase A-like enzyme
MPNLILMTSHDTGRHLGCYGVDSVPTPNLDRMCSGGTRFTNYHSTAALCAPSRCCTTTGLYPQSNGMICNPHAPAWWSLNDPTQHISHLLRAAGYHTKLLGHQHESMTPEQDLAFHEQSLYKDPDTHYFTHAEKIGRAAADWLEGPAAQSAPFYLQIGFFETHKPYHCNAGTEPFDDLGVDVPPYLVDNGAARRELAAFQGSAVRLDAGIGRILDALERTGLAEDTLLVYTVDHGIDVPRSKATLYQAGIEVGHIMQWPGVIPEGQDCDWLLSNVDFLPTAFELLGLDPPPYVEGRSFAGAFRGGQPTRHYAFAENVCRGTGLGDVRCVRNARYKLTRNFSARRMLRVPVDIENPKRRETFPWLRLHDLQEDPLELENLANDPDHADILQELDDKLFQWLREVDDPVLRGPTRTPYYDHAIADYEQRLG